jgi:2-hydroxychromene-2-carboxylate isomerase
MAVIDYYLFVQSPYAYLGHERFKKMAERFGATVNVLPMDATKVFPVSGGLPLSQRPPQRQAYRAVELKRWKAFLGVPMNVQPKFFPVAGDVASRFVEAAAETSAKAALDLAGLIGRAVWEREQNIADEAVLIALADECDLNGVALAARAKAPEIQAQYEKHTQATIHQQVFGAPTYMLNGEMFWGQDRLDFLERALAKIGSA